MRKINAFVSALILLLFLIHGITGAFQLTGIMQGGSGVRTVLSWVMTGLVLIHVVIGIVLTVQTLRSLKRSGASYFRENTEFWIRRISGFAMMLLIIFHVIVFTGESGEAFRLTAFGWLQLAAHFLLLLAILVHISVNIKPLLISFGIGGGRIYIKDILLVLSVILAVCAAAFIIYYIRWNIAWRY